MCCINILGQTLELFVSWSCFILKLLKILKSQDHLFLAWKPKTNLNIHRKIWSHIWALSISHFLDKKATLYHLRLLNMKLIHSLLEQHTLLLTCTLFNMHLYFSSLQKKKKRTCFAFPVIESESENTFLLLI